MYSRTLPLSKVTFGFVDVAVSSGILLSVATCTAANVFVLATAPSTATTLSWVISFVVAFVDSEGSDLLSAVINTICLPSTPPAALASLNASLIPLAVDWPK